MSDSKVFRVRECSLQYKSVTVDLPIAAGGEFTSSRMAAQLLYQYTAPMSGKEQSWCFHLNVQKYLVGAHLVGIGTLTTTLMNPRDVFREALCTGAQGIILGHNHPGGDPRPSLDDIETTKHIVQAASYLQMIVFDHVIVAPNDTGKGEAYKWYSMRKNGKL